MIGRRLPEERARRVPAALGSLLFLFAAPGMVAGFVPWWISRWHVQAPFLGFSFFRSVGALLIGAGILALLDSFARFALQGLGTPAPVSPPRRFVVSGLYRYVRNPMYIAVASTIVGQALFFGSLQLLEYGALFAVIVHVFVVAYEEPKLRATFGAEYELFCAHVPRWLPHVRPWRGMAKPKAGASHGDSARTLTRRGESIQFQRH
jgi:protein-S-isoprenylcysteine O-methyltransferase Ste14